MRTWRPLLLWLVAGLVGLFLLVALFPRVFPLLPRRWELTQREAVAIALERLRDLGPPVGHPYVVAHLQTDTVLERRLQKALTHGSRETLAASGLPDRVVGWRVLVYPPDAPPGEWVYQARISLAGKMQLLALNLDPKVGAGVVSVADARARADAFLRQEGIDPARYGPPELRSRQLSARTDLTLRYTDRGRSPLQGGKFGVEVSFAGDRLAGFSPWLEGGDERAIQREVQQAEFLGFGRIILLYLLLAALALPFLKRYHEGEIGVQRGVQIFLGIAAIASLAVLLVARSGSQGVG
ncbi:MAG TPA: hypothetical protein VGE98_03575, partial [Thermoanaerobaculia bacterium]